MIIKNSFIDCANDNKAVDYLHAFNFMKNYVECIKNHTQDEMIWFLEHNNVYTKGTSSIDNDLLSNVNTPVIQTNRGGKHTYHGTGQLICYLMLNLKKREINIDEYVYRLQKWIINVLSSYYEINAFAINKQIGVWINDHYDNSLKKIASIGVRVTHGITWHGFSLNVNKIALEGYNKIKPCGFNSNIMTSIESQKANTFSLKEVSQNFIKLSAF